MATFTDLDQANARIVALETEKTRLDTENTQLKQTEGESIGGVVKQAARQLRDTVEELATVRVLTIIGDAPLQAELNRQMNAANTSKGAPPTFAVTGAQGSITSINMATGDIQTFASADAVSGPLKTLHDEAVLKGTTILRENVRMLADVIEKLWSRAQH